MVGIFLGLRLRNVALQTTRIVCRRLVLQRLMGIVAGHAREACIRLAPALAVFQTIRRKANVINSNSSESVRDHIFPGAMASATEIY